MLELEDRTRSLAIRTLLGLAGLEQVWTPDGPAPAALALRRDGRGLAPEHRRMLTAAWALWDGSEPIPFAHLWTIDRTYSEALSGLILAASEGHEAVLAWIDEHTPRAVPARSEERLRSDLLPDPDAVLPLWK